MVTERYGGRLAQGKIDKLALENARYFTSVFTPTSMIYTVPFGQLNRIVKWLGDYQEWKEHPLNKRLSPYITEFVEVLKKLNVLEPRLQTNEKERKLSLFATEEETMDWESCFASTYSIYYPGSFAQLAQAHRHRTLDYSMYIPRRFEAFIPPILDHFPENKQMWTEDMQLVKDIFPQGQLVHIYEQGNLENFILKCKERLCTHAQQEIMRQTQKTLKQYVATRPSRKVRSKVKSYELTRYLDGARCTFPDYTCSEPCGFAEGINLTRDI